MKNNKPTSDIRSMLNILSFSSICIIPVMGDKEINFRKLFLAFTRQFS